MCGGVPSTAAVRTVSGPSTVGGTKSQESGGGRLSFSRGGTLNREPNGATAIIAEPAAGIGFPHRVAKHRRRTCTVVSHRQGVLWVEIHRSVLL